MPAALPLVVDADRALIRASLLLEPLIALSTSRPLAALAMAGRLVMGAAPSSAEATARARLDVATLPVDERVVGLAQAAAREGRPVYLYSARDALLVERLRQRFPFVTGGICGAVDAPLDGEARDRVLADRFPLGFDYVGRHRTDTPACRQCRKATLVGGASELGRPAIAPDATTIETLPAFPWLGPLIRSCRLHQWVKNVLVFAPLVLGGRLTDPGALAATVAAFVAMGLVASATYIINDALDLQDDRRHWSKRLRPLASGALSLGTALPVAVAILLAGLGIGAMIAGTTLGAISAYVALTLAYSVSLKRLPILDGLTLAALYTLRLVVGITAAGVPPSPWLLVFSMFLFVSLSLAKRFSELHRARERGRTDMPGRGYRSEDLHLVLALGVATGVSAVIVTVFYILDDAFRQSFYGRTIWLWGFPPLMFLFITRTWLQAVRGEMSDDPIVSAIRDRSSQIVLLLLIVCFSVAWLG